MKSVAMSEHVMIEKWLVVVPHTNSHHTLVHPCLILIGSTARLLEFSPLILSESRKQQSVMWSNQTDLLTIHLQHSRPDRTRIGVHKMIAQTPRLF
jgi:hypothetical protein